MAHRILHPIVISKRSFLDRAFGKARLYGYKLLALLMLFCLTSLPVLAIPASPHVIAVGFGETYRKIRFAILTGNLSNDLSSRVLAFFTSALNQERERPVASVKVSPEVITLMQGEEAVFTAIAFDRAGEPISGVAFEWSSRAQGGDRTSYLVDSTFSARQVGDFVVEASIRGVKARAAVTVLPLDDRSNAVEYEVSSRSGSRIKTTAGVTTSQSLLPGDDWDSDTWLSADDPGNQTGDPPGSPADGGAGNGNFQFSAPIVSLPGRGIDLALNLNYNSRVWNKSGTNLTFDIDYGYPAPGWTLGFGKIVHMGSGGCMMINADGTRVGYAGSLTTWSTGMSFKGYTTDGSFIDYGCNFTYGGMGSGWSKLANGTSITYSTVFNGVAHVFPTKITDAQGNYITITYRNSSAFGPEIDTITDTLGRVITFHYDSYDRLIEVRGPRMQGQDPMYGTATVRTFVRIHYKALTLNHSFAYGYNPVVRNGTPWVIDAIYYPATNTGYWFGADPTAADYNTYYSSYGMIAKVVEQRGMNWTPGPETQGTVAAGTMTKQALYNYPLTTANENGRTNGIGLTDAPTYDSLEESWAGMDEAEGPKTRYKINLNASPRVTNVIQPNGALSRQLSYNAPGQYYDGLVYQDETYVPDPNGTFTFPDLNLQGNYKQIAKSTVSWQNGNYSSPRPTQSEVWDENGHKVKTVYEYTSGKFNQVTKSCDYDNANIKLRCTVAQYQNSQNYIGYFNTSQQFVSGRHIFNLVLATGVENPDGTRASWTEYEYDNYQNNPLVNTPGVIRHAADHNPYDTSTYACNCGWSCELSFARQRRQANKGGGGGIVIMSPPDCEDGSPPWWTCEQCLVFDPATNYRGNITKVTAYADAQTLSVTPVPPVVETRSYDITGNLVRASSSCCEETSILYDDPVTTARDNYYAYPLIQTRGASDPNSPQHRVTTSAVYSFETGLVTDSKDANGLLSKTWYNPDTLRPVKAVSTTQAYTTFEYDDPAMTITEEVFEITTNGPLTAGKTKKYLNGVGQVRKEESFAPNGIVDIVETRYTKFGEVWRKSRPYRSGDPIYWSERSYDNQRRLIKVVEQDENGDPTGTETKAFYNEAGAPSSATNAPGNKMRVMDAWGRERWGRYDQQGRLVEVVEPNPDPSANPTGSLSVAGNLLTKYSYDTLGRLIQTEQGAQIRKFKYDSLGRLTRQKLAEHTATLNDDGTFVGAGQPGANWSEAFEYDTRSNLTKKTDPRGVRTLFSYNLPGGGLDPLNRIQSRNYDTSGPLQPGLTIHAAPSVAYEYMTTDDKSRIRKITTSGVLTEEYGYDAQSRVSEYKQTVAGRPIFTIGHVYDTLDRVKEIHYPEQYGPLSGVRKIIKRNYDTASRLETLTYGTELSQAQHASGIQYNAAGQTIAVTIGNPDDPNANPIIEQYTFDPQTGLLTNQTASRGGTELLNLSYEYGRGNSVGSLNGKTGHLTRIIDNLNTNKNREYEFDALGRLTKAKGGVNGTLWSQTYSYDRYGNRTNVAKTGSAADGSPIPIDGVPDLSYDDTSNRVRTEEGFEYDAAGNQTRSLAPDGTWLRYEYDAANRLRYVKKDDANQTLAQAFIYGSTNAKLIDYDVIGTGLNTLYASVGGTVLAEYVEYAQNIPTWTKSYTYLGDTQLATITPTGSAEQVEFNHPDRLGTRLKTNPQSATSVEQAHLPFGTALNEESTLTDNNKRFTSYERSLVTGLDYAVNRTYDSKLGRFTQVDPIGIGDSSLADPQSLNLYAYCQNDPINYTDPSGLGFLSFLKKLFRAIINFFKSGVAKKIAVKFVVNFVISGGNFGVAIRSVVPDILRQLGLSQHPYITPGWNPNLRYPISFGVSPLSKYIIQNLLSTGSWLLPDCDLAKLFGDVGAYFFDNWTSKDDPIMGTRPGVEHSHLYGSATDQSVKTGVYFPAGGKIVSPTTRVPFSQYLGSSRNDDGTHNANYILVQYDRPGRQNDVTLAIYHIDNFKLEKQADGRTRVGDIGFSQDDNWGSGGHLGVNQRYGQKKTGGHSHFELMKGLKWNLSNKKLLPIQNLCPTK